MKTKKRRTKTINIWSWIRWTDVILKWLVVWVWSVAIRTIQRFQVTVIRVMRWCCWIWCRWYRWYWWSWTNVFRCCIARRFALRFYHRIRITWHFLLGQSLLFTKFGSTILKPNLSEQKDRKRQIGKMIISWFPTKKKKNKTNQIHNFRLGIFISHTRHSSFVSFISFLIARDLVVAWSIINRLSTKKLLSVDEQRAATCSVYRNMIHWPKIYQSVAVACTLAPLAVSFASKFSRSQIFVRMELAY